MNLDGYLLGIIGTVLLCSVLTAIVPEGKTTSVIKGVTRLACLLAIISPIPYFLQKENIFDKLNGENTQNANAFFSENVIQTDERFIKYYSEMRIRDTESALAAELKEKFSVKLNVKIVWEFDGETGEYDTDKIQITQICVRLDEELSEEEKREMSNYLTKNYCSEVLLE